MRGGVRIQRLCEVLLQVVQIESPMLYASAAVHEDAHEGVKGRNGEGALCSGGDSGVDLRSVGEEFIVEDA
jgi:hypothetical protein